MSTTSSIFTGTSAFSSDFNEVISRAVAIASLPITGLTTNRTALTSEQSALSTLSASLSTLQAAVTSVGKSMNTDSYSVSHSDTTVGTATATTGALSGTYNLQIVDPGSQARAGSAATVSDPSTESISTSATFTLTANGQTYANIMPPPGTNTLTSLVSAINTATQGAVQATIVNVGTPSQPNYQLSIQNSAFGELPIELDDGTGNLLGTPTTATAVQYRINGQPAEFEDPISTDTRTLVISPNLSFSVLKAGTVDITVGRSTSSIASALSSFVAAYNGVSQALDAQRGTNGGALAGHGVINTLSQVLQNITSYSGTGSIQSIADIGMSFDSNGILSFDATVLTKAASADPAAFGDFLGTPTTGGFLQAAANALTSILDSTSGTMTNLLSTVAGEITSTNSQISQNQDRVDQLQKDLTAQMTAADALIAQMQQQLTYVTNLFSAMTANQKT